MTVPHVLVIEDNALLAAGLRNNLEFEGYGAEVASTGREGLRLARQRTASLIVLDLMLPDMDGFRVLRELRDRGVDTPVLILTAMGEETDKVRGFRFGADDYVTKPFSLIELLARVSALLRRSRATANSASPTRVFGDIQVNTSTREVLRGGVPVSLRPKEYDLLMALVQRDGAVASREDLLQEVWGYDDSVFSRTVDTHVAELRRKLEADPAAPQWLLTVRKAGYRLA
jgi:DNA-binding response OmpR family regulator